MKEWYHQTQEELCKELETCSEGLSSETAAKHLEKYGKNAIAEARKKACLADLFGAVQGSSGDNSDNCGADLGVYR